MKTIYSYAALTTSLFREFGNPETPDLLKLQR